MKHQIPLKYACLDKFTEIVKDCKDDNVARYLIELRDLITYQMEIIREQRMVIVANKHSDAWKHYDKPIENYDPTTRKYLDKPPKSGNMSC